MSDCERVLALIPELADGDVSGPESELASAHLKTCQGCSDRLASFLKVDAAIVHWDSGSVSTTFGQRERLASQMRFPARPRRVWTWAVPLALAAGLAVFWLIPRGTPVPANGVESRFIDIPYLAPLAPNENTTVVRMDVQVATLQAAGYRVNADPGETVPVDVLLGEDGRPHAVRVLADIDVNGAGD